MTDDRRQTLYHHLSSIIHHLSRKLPIFTVHYLLMKLVRHIPPFLRNKYLLSLTVFAVWMIFFDKNDLFTQMERRGNLTEIEESKAYFAGKIAESRKFSKEIQSDAAAIEKFAREKYLMKRENEDLFLVQKAANQ